MFRLYFGVLSVTFSAFNCLLCFCNVFVISLVFGMLFYVCFSVCFFSSSLLFLSVLLFVHKHLCFR